MKSTRKSPNKEMAFTPYPLIKSHKFMSFHRILKLVTDKLSLNLAGP